MPSPEMTRNLVGREHLGIGDATTAPAAHHAATADNLPGPPPAQALTAFSIPLGFAGLGGVWQAMTLLFSAPRWPAEVLFGLSGVLWLTISAAYLGGVARRPAGLRTDRQHPIHGPFAGYIPVVGVLLASHYEQYNRTIGRLAVIVFVIAIGILMAQLLAYWLRGNLPAADLHPGYLLPTVAGPFIASIGLGSSGWTGAAQTAFGAGIFFWLTMGTVVLGRLFTGPALPESVKPALVVLISPPVTAGIAWFVITDGDLDTVAHTLLGITIVLFAVELFFIPDYRALTFGRGFWTFTFPLAASSNFAVRWLAASTPPHAAVYAWSIATAIAAFIALITIAALATGNHSFITRRIQRRITDTRSTT